MSAAEVAGEELRRLLELTLEQQRIKRLIDLSRARIDEVARSEHARTGAAPTWKIKGLGQIRLDGVDPEPIPYVADGPEFGSWLAQQHPSEVRASIAVPADRLEEAIDALGFAEIPVESSTAEPREAFLSRFLDTLTLVDVEDGHGWQAVDDQGQLVPGVGGRVASSPRLVVAADRAAKQAVIDDADATYAAEQAAGVEPAEPAEPAEQAS